MGFCPKFCTGARRDGRLNSELHVQHSTTAQCTRRHKTTRREQRPGSSGASQAQEHHLDTTTSSALRSLSALPVCQTLLHTHINLPTAARPGVQGKRLWLARALAMCMLSEAYSVFALLLARGRAANFETHLSIANAGQGQAYQFVRCCAEAIAVGCCERAYSYRLHSWSRMERKYTLT